MSSSTTPPTPTISLARRSSSRLRQASTCPDSTTARLGSRFSRLSCTRRFRRASCSAGSFVATTTCRGLPAKSSSSPMAPRASRRPPTSAPTARRPSRSSSTSRLSLRVRRWATSVGKCLPEATACTSSRTIPRSLSRCKPPSSPRAGVPKRARASTPIPRTHVTGRVVLAERHARLRGSGRHRPVGRPPRVGDTGRSPHAPP